MTFAVYYNTIRLKVIPKPHESLLYLLLKVSKSSSQNIQP